MVVARSRIAIGQPGGDEPPDDTGRAARGHPQPDGKLAGPKLARAQQQRYRQQVARRQAELNGGGGSPPDRGVNQPVELPADDARVDHNRSAKLMLNCEAVLMTASLAELAELSTNNAAATSSWLMTTGAATARRARRYSASSAA